MQDGLRKLRSAQLLRSLGSKNEFTKAAAEVVGAPAPSPSSLCSAH